MKAIACTEYGPPEVLQLKGVEQSVPRGNEVLIEVHAASVAKRNVVGSGWYNDCAKGARGDACIFQGFTCF